MLCGFSGTSKARQSTQYPRPYLRCTSSRTISICRIGSARCFIYLLHLYLRVCVSQTCASLVRHGLAERDPQPAGLSRGTSSPRSSLPGPANALACLFLGASQELVPASRQPRPPLPGPGASGPLLVESLPVFHFPSFLLPHLCSRLSCRVSPPPVPTDCLFALRENGLPAACVL
ncbi:hypothetical protein TgHK011_001867 [Trichoderma gracile]|nr:hypothetical protein TgHK011_001867 [Trichoderma gracile]